eukprot:TRINITY_DN34089_c0_g1_i1.p1 TRINITY_DN34089_c0_g1~~TRINITY_DN34089_c0_g1_i1.p1  ORF type:complete len:467 (+),score=98.52 TRINITY_DN34089_c0_g1_i1:32-1432(+)
MAFRRRRQWQLSFLLVALASGLDLAGSALDSTARQYYLDACKALQIQPSSDVLIRLGLAETDLSLLPTGDRPFADLELEALVSLLELDGGKILATLRSMDFSACSLGPAGVSLVVSLLEHPMCKIERLDLSNQPVGPEGMQRLAPVLGRSSSIRNIRLKYCHLGDDGGSTVVHLLRGETKLEKMDLQNNYIGFHTCMDISKAALARKVIVELMGNEVLDEVFNSVSHGFGEMLAVIGTVVLMRKVRGGPAYERWSMAAYCASLNILYLCSTLFHSFFALGRTTVSVFKTLDHSAIFLLIAGSYTPFFGVVLRDFWWARPMLVMMWVVSFVGIVTELAYQGPYELVLRLSLYLALGWAVVVCIKPLTQRLGCRGTLLLALGGVLYTGGVPFFVRGEHTLHIPDHTIWHLWVLAASIAHYICIYKYATLDGEKERAKEQGREEQGLETELLAHSSDSEADEKLKHSED